MENSLEWQSSNGRKKPFTASDRMKSHARKYPLDVMAAGDIMIFTGDDDYLSGARYAARSHSVHRYGWRFKTRSLKQTGQMMVQRIADREEGDLK